jgi:hypothetical protein
MIGIYHEKQIGALCAVHCLNNLMQSCDFESVAHQHQNSNQRCQSVERGSGVVRHQFIPALGHEISLAEIGRAMDREEARELGISSQVAHNNVRNDGFFSLQVRSNAPHSPKAVRMGHARP